jgi:Ser/Thr protein kinase RdoA (MazF antagonist)
VNRWYHPQNAMKPFETLTNAGQLKRLRQLAVNALAAYEVSDSRLTPLLHEDNTTFRVDPANGERYVLRIHRPLRTVEAVRSEMTWLAALRRETDFVVPEPIPTRAGDLLTVASLEGIPEPRICVLFRWIDGRFLDSRLTPSHMERVGAFMARLQFHGAQFQRPEGFMRGRLDNLTDQARRLSAHGASEAQVRAQIDHPEDETAAIRLITEVCSPEDGARVATLIRKIREVQRAVGQGPETFGLIHGDLHQGNYLFYQGQVRAIDFDDCGYGYYLYDMAVTLSEVNWRKNTSALRTSFLAGYRSVYNFPFEHEQYLDTFIALRDLQLLIWKIEMRDHPAFRAGWESSVREMLQDIKDFIEQ